MVQAQITCKSRGQMYNICSWFSTTSSATISTAHLQTISSYMFHTKGTLHTHPFYQVAYKKCLGTALNDWWALVFKYPSFLTQRHSPHCLPGLPRTHRDKTIDNTSHFPTPPMVFLEVIYKINFSVLFWGNPNQERITKTLELGRN
jgi:hypothetical protein